MHAQVNHPVGVVKRISAVIAACVVMMVGVLGVAMPANALTVDGTATDDPRGLGRIGYQLTNSGEGMIVWLGNQIPVDGVPQFCVMVGVPVPTADDQVIDVASVPEPTISGTGYEVTPAQMAWLLNKYQFSTDRDTLATLSFLIHANFEQDDWAGGRYTLEGSKENMIFKLVEAVERLLPQVASKAKAFISEAKSSGVTGYASDVVSGENTIKGTITGFKIQKADGSYLTGVDVTVTIDGPAVWEETGTQTITFKTAAGDTTKAWRATGNGEVTYKVKYTDKTGTLKHLLRDGTAQDTIRWDTADKTVEFPGEKWRVVFDFQPMGVSSGVKVSDNGVLVDSFDAKADPDYGSGTWLTKAEVGQSGEGGVPVTFTARAYKVGGLGLPKTQDAVPDDAHLVGEKAFTVSEPSTVKATFDVAKYGSGFYTVVWSQAKKDQPSQWQRFIHDDFTDGYGVAEETISFRYPMSIDSALSYRDTKSGTYLVDDVWVSGLPADHPGFAGGMRFQADEQVISHKVLFFPEKLAITDANASKAEQIGNTVTIPAKNGFYPSVGDTSWLAKKDAKGNLVPGTYVFVSEFKGDDRVLPLRTSVTDVNEQLPVQGLHTTLMYKNSRLPVPAVGTVKLTDKVSYTNAEVGKRYEVTGTVMDRSTGKPLTVKGKEVTATTEFVAKTRNGNVDVTFEVPGSVVEGKTIVAFEELWHQDERIAIHADLKDENQTLKVTKIRTTASDKADGDQMIEPVTKASITDKVCDVSKSLAPGTTYQIKTSLMNRETGKAILDADGQPVTASTSFVPKSSDDCAQVTLTFDASELDGSTVVVFEDVYRDGHLVGVHHDLKDEKQMIEIVEHEIVTTASDKADGNRVLDAAPDQVIVDRVCDANKKWSVGREYEIVTSLVHSDGQPFLGKDGKHVTVKTQWTPEQPGDCVEIEIPFDASSLEGKSLVVFEDVLFDGDVVGVHHDLKDKKQTVEFPTDEELAKTGAGAAGIAGTAIGTLLAGGAAVAVRRKVGA